jgi:tRNA (guanine37-N1)-methyltransferase
MKIEIATLFPEMCESVLAESIIGRARKKGAVDISCRNIRDYTKDKHRRVDDTPYGGGMGMVMQADPIFNCYEAVCQDMGAKPHTIYMSPKGNVFTQKRAVELASYDNILIICGHYEGVDQRVLDEIVDEEISIGDYVLTGGELPALVIADAVSRMCEGVLSDELCYQDESHFNGLLEYPQYTRPEEWHGVKVPEVLLSGHHKNINDYRLTKSIEITKERRPDMYEKYLKSNEEPNKQ